MPGAEGVFPPARVCFPLLQSDPMVNYAGPRKERPLMEQNQPSVLAWRRELKVKIVWALAAKLVGLTLLWMLFFRGHG